jgi:hypothetical protein
LNNNTKNAGHPIGCPARIFGLFFPDGGCHPGKTVVFAKERGRSLELVICSVASLEYHTDYKNDGQFSNLT